MEERLGDRDYLQHIQKAVLELKSHTAGMGFEDYCADTRTQRAVERNLEIIGEASKNLSDSLKQKHPQIPWTSVYGARNKLVHYLGADQKIPWGRLAAGPRPAFEEGRGALSLLPKRRGGFE